MNKKNSNVNKLLKKVQAIPLSASLTWVEVETLMSALGAKLCEGSGSRIQITLNDYKLTIHKPHQNKEFFKKTVKSLQCFLKQAGVASQY